MRVPTFPGAPGPQASSRGSFHPYSPASPANGSWLFSDSSDSSSGSAGDSILSDDGMQPISASFNRGGRQPPRRLVLYPTPVERLPAPVNERGCPTVAQYLAVETAYINDHAPARRMKALITYESMCEIAQVLAQFNEPLPHNGRFPPLSATGIMATSAMRHWALSKFTLSHDGVVLCKGKQVLVREQFYSALCWAHLQSSHGGRDKTSRMLWRYGGVPKELIMRFVASCPTCVDKTTAIRRTAMNIAAKAERSETTSDSPDHATEDVTEDADEDAAESATIPSPRPEILSFKLPPLRQVLSSIFHDNDQMQMPHRVQSILDSPTNFSPAGSAFDEVPSPPQGYVSRYQGYTGVSITSPANTDVTPLEALPAFRRGVLQLGSSAPPAPAFNAEANEWIEYCPAADNEDSTDDSCISDDSANSSALDYSSSPYSQAPARDALMFAWNTAPMQRQAATEGVGLSPPSSPLMRGYARLASPAPVEESPSATAHLLGHSPAAAGGISGWSPTSVFPTSPAAADSPQFPSPFYNAPQRLFDTPLSRFSDRTFQQRWEAMYSARNVDLSHLQGSTSAPPLEGSEEHPITVDEDSLVYESIVEETPSAPDSAQAEPSSLMEGLPVAAPSIDMQYGALGFVHKPIGRARAHSHSLGLALQTDFPADNAPTPPLTGTSTLTVHSPVSPGLETPAHSLLMQISTACKSDNFAGAMIKEDRVDEAMLPWAEGLPTEHDPLAPHNMLSDWIHMDYVQAGDGQLKFGNERAAHETSSGLPEVEIA